MPSEPGDLPRLPAGRAVTLPARGTTFVYEVPGPEGAPTLVLLHGWTATAALNWFACFRPLGRHFRVLALDHRGHGRGIRSRRPFRLEDCADDVAALAEVLGLEHIIPVGYSMGGSVAQLVWRRHRQLVDGLVLCATARRFAARRPTDTVLFPTAIGLSMAASMSPAALQRRIIGLVLANRLDGTAMAEWVEGELRRNDPGALLQAGVALRLYDARGWLPGVDVPAAVVMTTADTVVPPSSQLALAASVPEAEVYRVDGDHGVCARQPRRFVPVLTAACLLVARRAHATGASHGPHGVARDDRADNQADNQAADRADQAGN
jgi:pimeloyl-ACP methyl ester carboxylesterase